MELAKTVVKQEAVERPSPSSAAPPEAGLTTVIELSSSSSISDSDSEVEDAFGGEAGSGPGKKARDSAAGEGSDKAEKKAKKVRASGALPLGFLDPLLPPDGPMEPPPVSVEPPLVVGELLPITAAEPPRLSVAIEGSKQFWKAGEYDGAPPPAIDSLPLNGNFLSCFIESLEKVSVA